eukprot:11156904-Karenia_brevis.AAC.1
MVPYRSLSGARDDGTPQPGVFISVGTETATSQLPSARPFSLIAGSLLTLDLGLHNESHEDAAD